jgi:hypothetical protein
MHKASRYFVLLTLFISSCNSNTEERVPTDQKHSEESSRKDNDDSGGNCGFNDGTYSADVEYNNPNTGFSNEYTLDVEVEDCQVIQIDFNNGGYLDGDHIDPADINEDGSATVEDDRQRTFEIQLDLNDKNKEDSEEPEDQ